MTAGRLYVRQLGANASEVVALVTPEMLQARADRAAALAGRCGDSALANVGCGPLRRVGVRFSRMERLLDLAHDLAAKARRALDLRPMPDFLVLCEECGEPHDIEATQLVGAHRYCATCAHDYLVDAAEAMRSDEYDYHHDRGHGHGC